MSDGVYSRVYRGVSGLPDRMHARIEAKGARHGLAYPWWIATASALGLAVCAGAALAQRDALLPPQAVALTLPLMVAPSVVQFVVRAWIPWWADAIVVLSATWWLLSDPLSIAGPADAAPGVLAILCAEVTATDGPRKGSAATVASMVLLGMADVVWGLSGTALYLLEVLLGLVIGYMLRWQMRALAAERIARAGERERATQNERERIAREIHDLVAHSLSVTLLHVTGARHALTDGEDVAEAIDALGDAERIGRQAMADIRRTVSMLATEPEGTRPLPGASDIADLVGDVRAAGLDVEYDDSGDPARLGQSAGLSCYRIVQESLSNVAKHAPGSTARVRFDVRGGRAQLTIRNALAVPGRRIDDLGSGIAGMTARTTRLGGTIRCGQQGAEWVVDVSIPLDRADGSCPLKPRVVS